MVFALITMGVTPNIVMETIPHPLHIAQSSGNHFFLKKKNIVKNCKRFCTFTFHENTVPFYFVSSSFSK